MNQKTVFFSVIVLLFFSVLFEPVLNLQSVFQKRRISEIEVLLDPGHGGIDGGAVGISGIVEKGINLDIAFRISDLLGLFGIHGVLTRTDDDMLGEESGTIRNRKNADLKERVKIANKMQNACMLSIHLNSYPDPSCHGSQVFYAPNDFSESLAKSIQTALRQGLDAENQRVAKPAERGHYLLNHVEIPAIIIECGFLSNSTEEQKLANDEYQKRLAVCIVQGYQNYQR